MGAIVCQYSFGRNANLYVHPGSGPVRHIDNNFRHCKSIAYAFGYFGIYLSEYTRWGLCFGWVDLCVDTGNRAR